MALTKVTYGLISADTSAIDLNIDQNTLYVETSGNRVGIGTTAPSKKLHVQNGSSGFSGSYNARTAAIIEGSHSAGTVLSIMAPNTGYSGIFFGDQDGEASGQIQYVHSVNAIKFLVNSGEKMLIDSSGNVGIGTTSPDRSLVVNHASDARVKLQENGTDAMQLQATSSEARVSALGGSTPLALHTNGAERMRIDSSGKVGIGNTSPLGKLTISNAAGTNAPTTVTAANTYLQLGSDDYGASNNGKFMIGFGYTDATNTNSPAYIGYEETSTSGDTKGELTFYTRDVITDTAPTERMRIDTLGNIGIAETNPQTPLHISSDSASGENIALQIDNNNTTAGNEIAMLFRSRVGTTNTDFIIAGIANAANDMDLVFQSDGATERMRIDSSGNLGIGTDSPTHLLHLESNVPTIKFTESDTSTNAFIQNTGGNLRLYADDGNSRANTVIGFHVDSSEKMIIDSSGALGLGTTPPTTNIHPQFFIGTESVILGSTGGALDIANNLYYNSGWKHRTTGAASLLDFDGSGNFVFYNVASAAADSAATLDEAIRITSDGKVGVGTGASAAYNLHVSGTTGIGITNGGGLRLLPTDASDTDAWIMYQYTDNTLRYNFTGAGADEIIIKYPNATNATTLLIDTEQKRIGIGTDSPGTGLHVKTPGVSAVTAIFERSTSSNSWVQIKGNSTNSFQLGSTSSGIEFYDDASSTYVAKINNNTNDHNLQKWCYAEFDANDSGSADALEEKANLAANVYSLYGAVINPGKYSNNLYYVGVGRENVSEAYVEFKVDLVEARSIYAYFGVANSADGNTRYARLWYSYDGEVYTQVDNNSFGAGGGSASYTLDLTSVLHHGNGDFTGSVYFRCGLMDNASSHVTLIGWNNFKFKAFAESMTFDGRYKRGSSSTSLVNNTGGGLETNFVPKVPYVHTFTLTSAGATSIETNNGGNGQFTSSGHSYLNKEIFQIVSSPTYGIQCLTEGTIFYTVHQDLRTTGTTSYASVYGQRVTSTASASINVGLHLTTNTGGEWDSISGQGSFDVVAGDIIRFNYSANGISSMDNGDWSYYTLMMIPYTTSAKGYAKGNTSFPYAGGI